MNRKTLLIALSAMLSLPWSILYAQRDTVRLKSGSILVGHALEVSEEYIVLGVTSGQLKDSTTQISTKNIRYIKYSNGYFENFGVEEPDTLRLLNSKILMGKVTEVEEKDILIREVGLSNGPTTRIFFDSIESISYATGYTEHYNNKRPSSATADAKTKSHPTTPPSISTETVKQPEVARSKSSRKQKLPKQPDTVDRSPAGDLSASNSGNPAGQLSEKAALITKEALKAAEEINAKAHFGIASVLDSASGLSRSFALLEILKVSAFHKEKALLTPELVDYPYNVTYAISGTFMAHSAKFKLYKKGKKVKEFICETSWKEVFNNISNFLATEDYIAGKRFSQVKEGEKYKFKEHEINNMLPGTALNLIPFSKALDTFKSFTNIRFYHDDHAFLRAMEVFGTYTKYDENDLFFFRNNDIPFNLKLTVKPLVFPLSKWLAPSLTYLSCGYLLSEKGDFDGALNTYFAALNSSNSLIASPNERALVKYAVFTEIYKLYLKEFPARVYLASLFKLGADVNMAFLNSYSAGQLRSEYYSGISKIRSICDQAENQARQIRGTKRFGFFMAALNTAGAMATTSPTDNTASNAFMDQAQAAINQTTEQASTASLSLNSAFDDINQRIDAGSYIISEGTQIDPSRSYLAEEILYYLRFSPETTKDVLLSFSSGKPILLEMTAKYFDLSENINQAANLRNIGMHLAEIEAKAVASESREIPVSQKTISEF